MGDWVFFPAKKHSFHLFDLKINVWFVSFFFFKMLNCYGHNSGFQAENYISKLILENYRFYLLIVLTSLISEK